MQFYRFRKLENLFNYEELEKQTIYFAPPEDLNDPMEGFKNIFWKGDEIVWKNLFKHYLLCFEHVFSLYILCGEEYRCITEADIPVYKSYDDFPTKIYKELFDKIFADFYDICKDLIKRISKKTSPVRRDELYSYLINVHFVALNIIKKNYEQKSLIPKQRKEYSFKLNHIIKKIDLIEKSTIEMKRKAFMSKMFLLEKSFFQDMYLENLCFGNISKYKNKNFIIFHFVEKYINSLEQLLYSQWYTACFMTEFNNSSAWGHYGDGHKGICLIFDSEQKGENCFITLKGKSGNTVYKFYKINYEEGFVEIDFFKSMGKLSINNLLRTWYKDESGALSNIFESILEDNGSWREKYWDNFYKNITIKTQDWSYEQEYRLIMSYFMRSEIKIEDRALQYDFSQLKGIIFGIKTSNKDKAKIISIIQKKCCEHGRNDFKFYQAYYNSESKDIQHRELMLFNDFSN